MTTQQTNSRTAASTEQPAQSGERASRRRSEDGTTVDVTETAQDVQGLGGRHHRDEIPSVVIDVLTSPGEPLDDAVRREMEVKMGADFSDVRVHTGPKAAAAAESIDARAFTYGKHIVFNRGEYRPETAEGRKLLAHELVHVVQQTGNGGGPAEDAGGEESFSQFPASITGPGQTPLTIGFPGNPAEREALWIANQVMSGWFTADSGTASDVHFPCKASVSGNPTAVQTMDYSQHREKDCYNPITRIGRSIQRQQMKKATSAMLSEPHEIPQDGYTEPPMTPGPGSKKHFGKKAGEVTYAIQTGYQNWKIVVPKKLKKKKKLGNFVGGEPIILESTAQNDRAKQESIIQSHLKPTVGITSSAKRKAIMSGKPAGVKVGNGKRFIRGPAEKHLLAATRALHPEYNNNIMNVWFCSNQLTEALKASNGGRRVAYRKKSQNKSPIKTPGSIEGWKDRLGPTGLGNFVDWTVIMAKSFGWSDSKVKKIGKQTEAGGPDTKSDQHEISRIIPQNTSKRESARLLAAFLHIKSQNIGLGWKDQEYPYIKALFARLSGRFIRTNLDNAVRLLQKQDLEINTKAIKKFVSTTNLYYTSHKGTTLVDVKNGLVPDKIQENPKSALFKQTLINMGLEVARAVHQMGLVTVQYIYDNNKNWNKVDFNDETRLKNEFGDIAGDKSFLLEQYSWIVQGFQKLNKEAKKDIKSTVKTIASIATVGASALAGSLGALATFALDAGLALIVPALTSVVNKGLTKNGKIKPSKMNGEWDEVIKFQKSKYKKAFMDNFKTKSLPKKLENNKNNPLTTLGSLMHEEVKDNFVSPFIE